MVNSQYEFFTLLLAMNELFFFIINYRPILITDNIEIFIINYLIFFHNLQIFIIHFNLEEDNN